MSGAFDGPVFATRPMLVAFGILLLGGCAKPHAPAERSVLEDGAALPAGFTALELSTSSGSPRIDGAFVHDGRRIRFITQRGPRIALDEVLSGAGEFEIDACYLDERGRPFIRVAGGHEIHIPECLESGEQDEQIADHAGELQDQAVAARAMEELARLPFKPQYRDEQKALTGTLDFLRRGPGAGMGIAGEMVMEGTEQDGPVTFQAQAR